MCIGLLKCLDYETLWRGGEDEDIFLDLSVLTLCKSTTGFAKLIPLF